MSVLFIHSNGSIQIPKRLLTYSRMYNDMISDCSLEDQEGPFRIQHLFKGLDAPLQQLIGILDALTFEPFYRYNLILQSCSRNEIDQLVQLALRLDINELAAKIAIKSKIYEYFKDINIFPLCLTLPDIRPYSLLASLLDDLPNTHDFIETHLHQFVEYEKKSIYIEQILIRDKEGHLSFSNLRFNPYVVIKHKIGMPIDDRYICGTNGLFPARDPSTCNFPPSFYIRSSGDGYSILANDYSRGSRVDNLNQVMGFFHSLEREDGCVWLIIDPMRFNMVYCDQTTYFQP